MSSEPGPAPSKLMPQVVLLVLALAGWTAFAWTYLGLLNVREQRDQIETQWLADRRTALETARIQSQALQFQKKRIEDLEKRPRMPGLGP